VKLDPEVWGNVFPELIGPDETQTRPILGFRINRVQLVRRSWRKCSVVLRSMGPTGYSWAAGRNEAVCLPSGRTVPVQPRHLAPATKCGCGIYAVHDIDWLSAFTHPAPDDFVLAGVAGTGIVRIHTNGWRAQFARIVAFSAELPEIPIRWRRLPHPLTPREQRVLQLRFGLIGGHPLTLEEVGKKFGVARERIRQIEAKALQKLRHPSRREEAQRLFRVPLSPQEQQILCLLGYAEPADIGLYEAPSVPRRLSATVAEALEAKYQVPVVALDKLKEVMAGAGSFWEEIS